jgi:glycosyltransferase involved in cell wall biosynthesis
LATEQKDPVRPKIVVGITLTSSMAVFGKGFLAFLKQHGFDVYLCARKDMLYEKIEDEGFTFIEMPFERRFNPLNDLQLLYKFISTFSKIKPDVVDLMTLKPCAIGSVAAKLTGVPVIIKHLWGFMAECNYDPLRRTLLLGAHKVSNVMADRVVAVCQELKEVEEKSKRTSPDKTVVYGQGSAFGIDIDQFLLTEERKCIGEELRHRWSIKEGHRVFGSVMRVNVEKGVTELVDAFVTLYEKHPEYRLIIAGRHDIRNRPAQRILDLMDHHPGIRFVGFVDDIRDFYAAIDIFVLPTYREGFCNSNLEASSMSKPVISTNIIGVNNSSVIDGVTGLIVPPRDAARLAEKMELLAGNQILCEKLAQQGRNRVEAYFDKEMVWHNQLRDICELLKLKNIKPPVEPSHILHRKCSLCSRSEKVEQL